MPVVERVKELHKVYPKSRIETEITHNDEKRVIVKATVHIHNQEEGVVWSVFTGHSQAEWGVGMMGNVALEVAETSAVGRALGFANLGLVEGIASADEMRKVSKLQEDDSVPF